MKAKKALDEIRLNDVTKASHITTIMPGTASKYIVSTTTSPASKKIWILCQQQRNHLLKINIIFLLMSN